MKVCGAKPGVKSNKEVVYSEVMRVDRGKGVVKKFEFHGDVICGWFGLNSNPMQFMRVNETILITYHD